MTPTTTRTTGRDRRTVPRVEVQPMYHGLAVTSADDPEARRFGHVHDLSIQGVRFELDHPLEPGAAVEVELELPASSGSVRAEARIVWCDIDPADPGPVRMAAAFTRIPDLEHELRLHRHLRTWSRPRRAA